MKQLIQTYDNLKKLHAETYATLILERGEIETCSDMELLADKVYALREISRLADDLRKESHSLMEVASKIACIIWTAHSDGDPIRTDLCTATPKIMQGAYIPKREKNPKEYYALMQYLGIPKEVSERETVRVHWPSFCELLTEKSEKGEPLPGGIDPNKLYTKYSLSIRAKRPLETGKN